MKRSNLRSEKYHPNCLFPPLPSSLSRRDDAREPVGAPAAAVEPQPVLRAAEDVRHQHALPGRGQERHPRQAAQHEGGQVRVRVEERRERGGRGRAGQ